MSQLRKTRLNLEKTLARLVNNDIVWFVLKPIAKFGFFATYHRQGRQLNTINENHPYFPIVNKKEVLNGPFKGMKYPALSSVGSSLFPKLLGSYERELHQVTEGFFSENYSEIVDIGCAEGYYAIGLGLKLINAKVYAYDSDATARELCCQMAKVNNMKNRIIIKETCTAKELEDFKFTGKALIICDCEGYEKYLFNEQNVANLKNCDLLIEMHDFIDLNISGKMIDLFTDTHDLQIIKSIDDIEKAKTYIYEETNSLSLEEKWKLYQEWRPSIMEWLICTPKNA